MSSTFDVCGCVPAPNSYELDLLDVVTTSDALEMPRHVREDDPMGSFSLSVRLFSLTVPVVPSLPGTPRSGWRLPQPEQVAERIEHLAQPLTSHDLLRAPVRARAVFAPLSHRGVDVGDRPVRDRPGRPRLIELIGLMQGQPGAGQVEHHQLRGPRDRFGTE